MFFFVIVVLMMFNIEIKDYKCNFINSCYEVI